MTTKQDQELASGAQHVDETEHLAAHLTEPDSPAAYESEPEDGSDDPPVETHLSGLTLSMFQQGGSVRVRVGNPQNASELYEHAFDSADEANTALLEAGVLKPEQVSAQNEPAGTGIPLSGVTVQQLEAAGLKRHGVQTG